MISTEDARGEERVPKIRDSEESDGEVDLDPEQVVVQRVKDDGPVTHKLTLQSKEKMISTYWALLLDR